MIPGKILKMSQEAAEIYTQTGMEFLSGVLTDSKLALRFACINKFVLESHVCAEL